MPRLWIMSDLHLEAVPYPTAFGPERPDFDLLVVAGDVWEGDVDRAVRAVAQLAAGKPSAFVLGNHEYWNHDFGQRVEARRAAARHGVTLLDETADELAGVRFVGGTLWTDGRLGGNTPLLDDPLTEPIKEKRGRRERPATIGDTTKLHERTCDAISDHAYPSKRGPLVVVTHHAPHPLCLPEGRREGWPAWNAASDLSYLTDTGEIALWVHGHLHHNVDFTLPGGTRIVCNPAGPAFANPGFRDDWIIEV